MKLTFSTKAKKAISALVVCTTLNATALAAGLPVIDVGAIAQAIVQVENQVKQIKNMKNQLKAATGNAKLGALLDDPNVQEVLGKYTPQGISLSDLTTGNYDQTLQRIAKRMEKDIEKGQGAKDPKASLAQAVLINYAQTEKSLSDLEKMAKATQKTIGEIDKTTDASSKADLANTLSAQKIQIDIAIAQINLKMKQMEQLEKQAEKLVINDYVQRKKANNK